MPKIEEGTYVPNYHLLLENKKYQIPLSVDNIVRRSLPVFQDKMTNQEVESCPLYGFYSVERSIPPEDEIDYLQSMISGLSGYNSVVTERVEGCLAIKSSGCYLVKGTKRHPQVEKKEECPLYRRVQDLLEDLKSRGG